MDKCVQYWNQLLQEFRCENEDQLAALGIPIQKNELYLSACSAADSETKKRYEEVAALTLLHTHFHFVEYALANDVFFMSCWAKHYHENCVPNDEFDVIHQEILKAGGLDRFPQDNVSLSAMLLSAYGKLGLSLDLEPISRVKEIYISSMNVILDCILNSKTPSVPDRRTPLKSNSSAKGNWKPGYNLADFKNSKLQHYKLRLRNNATQFKIDRYCSYLFNSPQEVSVPVSNVRSEPLPDVFAKMPERYSLEVTLDGFGETAAQRYTYLAERIRPSAGDFNELMFSLLEKAYAADQLNGTYKDARYGYLQAGFENARKSIPSKFDSRLEQMTKAGTTMDAYDMEKPYYSILSEMQGALARILEMKQKYLSLSKVSDPKIEELWERYYADTEKEYAQIKTRADIIKRDVEETINKWKRKRKFKKSILPILIVLAMIIIALVIAGVLL